MVRAELLLQLGEVLNEEELKTFKAVLDRRARASVDRVADAGFAVSHFCGCASTPSQIRDWLASMQLSTGQMQLGWVIYSRVSETCQQSTPRDEGRQFQELNPFSAHPWRSGNSSPRRV